MGWSMCGRLLLDEKLSHRRRLFLIGKGIIENKGGQASSRLSMYVCVIKVSAGIVTHIPSKRHRSSPCYVIPLHLANWSCIPRGAAASIIRRPLFHSRFFADTVAVCARGKRLKSPSAALTRIANGEGAGNWKMPKLISSDWAKAA